MLSSLVVAAALAAPRSQCSAGQSCWPAADVFRSMGAGVSGDVVLPGDKLWKGAIAVKNQRFDIVPGAVLMAQTAADIQQGVRFGVAHNLDISVKSSGHCYSGNCMKAGSFNLDLTRMQGMELDVGRMELAVQPGTNFEKMYDLCDTKGVLVVGGMCNTVAPVGFSLGGGHGPLIRSYGLGADNIVSATMVDATGAMVNASADSNPDLFWALRGGGGGAFGVVVSLTVKVYQAPKQMVSLQCAWPFKHSGRIVAEPLIAKFYESILPKMPDEWMFYSAAMKTPLPAGVGGFNYLTMNGAFVVDGLYNGEYSPAMLDAVSDLLALGKDDQLKCDLKNWTSFKAWHAKAWFASEGPVLYRTYMASSFAQEGFDATGLAGLMSGTVTALPETSVSMMFGVQLGGKVARPDADSSVGPTLRNGLFMQENDADWTAAKKDEEEIASCRALGDAVANITGLEGAYLNEPDPSKGEGQYEDLFWGNTTFARLQKIKKQWDPNSTFACHQCVHN
eukprot:Hpha_TRINITY_DN15596_c3_g3::TRINITY_DN15596_c3_g3_i1::g.105298::m.105298